MSLEDAIQNIWTSDYTQKNPNKAYKVTYANEYAAVAAYLNGGPEPAWSGFSKLGKGLCEAEKERRGAVVVPPEPEPEPEPEPLPPGGYIDKISELTSVFLPQNTMSANIQQGVTNPPGRGGGIWEISDAAGSGFRFVATPQMPSNWEPAKKVCLAQLLIRPAVGQYEEWSLKYRYPSADNPTWPSGFHGGTIMEFGHHQANSGMFIGLDPRAGGEGHILGLGIPPFQDVSSSFQYITIFPLSQLVLDRDYLCEARIRYNPDSTGYVQVKIDGRVIIDESRPMRPNTSEIPKCQPGWYSSLGTTKNGVELRNLKYAYGV